MLSVVLALTLPVVTDSPPLLHRIVGSGFVPPERRIASHCRIFADRVVLETVTPGPPERATRLERSIELTGDLTALIDDASRGPMTHDVGPTDAPSEVNIAYKEAPDGSAQEVDLGSHTDAGISRNGSAAAMQLQRILSVLCAPLL